MQSSGALPESSTRIIEKERGICMGKKYTALITEKENHIGMIHRTDCDYSSKTDYASDCRANGYRVAAVLTDEEIDFIRNGFDKPEDYGMSFAQALDKICKYPSKVVDYVRQVLDEETMKSAEQRYYQER